jgi:hypothetical protein
MTPASMSLVGRGLAWHHWALYLRPDDDVSVMLMADQKSAIWAAMTSSWRNAHRVVANLGNGTAEYVGVQAEGGLVLSDDRRKQNGEMQSCSMWWIIKGPPEPRESVSRLK